MAPGDAAASGPPVVFVSYSREDGDWLSRFATMLRPLIRERRLELWSDTQIQTGGHWEAPITAAIARADAALLLVTPAFVASDYIVGVELPGLRARRIPLATVLV